jgi:lipopolysaccharide export system protein LptA
LNHLHRIIGFLLLLLLPLQTVMGQTRPTNQDTVPNRPVLVDFAEVFEYIQQGDSTFQRLLGSVELRQDSIYMYCDTAIISNEQNVVAWGNVTIQQGDSISVFADSLLYQGDLQLADLYGGVVLQSGSQKLFTDTLKYDLNQKLATYESGALLTNDTTQLTSRRGYFYVGRNEVFFKDSVRIIDPNFELKTDTLAYHTENQIATFLAPTLIVQDSSRIYCEGGYYDIGRETALFKTNAQYQRGETFAFADSIRYDGLKELVQLKGNAQFEEPDRIASADVLEYEEATEIIRLSGNARYREDRRLITGDTIVYDQKQELYFTRGRSLVSDPPQLIEADQLDFDQEVGLGIAVGNVIWRDTSSDLTILCGQANYREEDDYIKAFGGRSNRALLISGLEEDSLFMTSDTLVAYRRAVEVDTLASFEGETIPSDSLQRLAPSDSLQQTMPLDTIRQSDTVTISGPDSVQLIQAYHDVRIFKSDLQALCDSLSYSTADSLFRLFHDPIIWSDTSQIFADTVLIQMAENAVDRLFFNQNAYIINSPDLQFFNQIAGNRVVAYFVEGSIDRMKVLGNAESIYYAMDETDAYIGVNQTVSSEMLIRFLEGNIDQIVFYYQPEGVFTPMSRANHAALKLEGFRWEFDRRPQSVDDLFDD